MSLMGVYYILLTQGRDQHGTPVSNVIKILIAPKKGMFWVIKRVLPFAFIFLVNVKLSALFFLFKLVI
jgi:hypothetical protein